MNCINNKIGKGHRNTNDHFKAEIFGDSKISVTVPVPAAGIISTAATPAISTAETTASALAIFSLFYYQRLFAQGTIIQAINSFFCFGVIWHFYKTKSPAFPGFLVHSHFSRLNYSEFFKYLFQFCIIKIVRESGNKKVHT